CVRDAYGGGLDHW
nr:immunoglobulin heavy chain junction region [Macaca mulatta]MOY20256.1 immunoglobulin heavy chain junction region [Macaca mulatta]